MAAASRHPFEVGRQYRNWDGDYTVVSIHEPDMVIRYTNGRTLTSAIVLQARIWEGICEDEEFAAAHKLLKQTAAGSSRPRDKRRPGGGGAQGLVDGDFKDDVTGTSWRRREGFGGMLAARLAALSAQPFESYSIYRRPEVYVALPQFYAPGDSRRNAKFFFNLDERAAHHGFWIEKSDEAMDATWDWLRFTAALAREKRLQAQTLVAMQRYGVCWEIQTDEPAEGASSPRRMVMADEQGLCLQGEGSATSALSWPDFMALLAAIPADQWCNLYLAAHVPKARAVERGVELGQEAATIYHALLPLYMAAVRPR